MPGGAQPDGVDGELLVGLVEDFGGGRDGDDVVLEDKVADAPTGGDVVPEPLEEGVLRGHQPAEQEPSKKKYRGIKEIHVIGTNNH